MKKLLIILFSAIGLSLFSQPFSVSELQTQKNNWGVLLQRSELDSMLTNIFTSYTNKVDDLASQAEANAGTDTTKYISANRLANYSGTLNGTIDDTLVLTSSGNVMAGNRLDDVLQNSDAFLSYRLGYSGEYSITSNGTYYPTIDYQSILVNYGIPGTVSLTIEMPTTDSDYILGRVFVISFLNTGGTAGSYTINSNGNLVWNYSVGGVHSFSGQIVLTYIGGGTWVDIFEDLP